MDFKKVPSNLHKMADVWTSLYLKLHPNFSFSSSCDYVKFWHSAFLILSGKEQFLRWKPIDWILIWNDLKPTYNHHISHSQYRADILYQLRREFVWFRATLLPLLEMTICSQTVRTALFSVSTVFVNVVFVPVEHWISVLLYCAWYHSVVTCPLFENPNQELTFKFVSHSQQVTK